MINGKRKRKRILSLLFVIVIAGGIFYFMLRSIITDWPIISRYPWNINWIRFFSSVGISAIASGLTVKAAHMLCAFLGGKVPFSRFLYIFCLSQLGRYLPGRVWNIVGFTVLMERENIRRTTALVLPFIHQGMLIALYFLVGTSFCGLIVITKLMPQFSNIVFLVSIFLLLGLFLFPFFTRFFSRLLPINLPINGYYAVLFILFLSGVVLCAAFFLFLSSFMMVSLKDAPFIGGSFLLSYVSGWIVFVAPAGIGVREGMLGVLLSSLLPPALSNMIALGARLWMTIAEIVLLAGVWIVVVLGGGKEFTLGNEKGIGSHG